jgi:hypothetical protein
MLKFSEALTKIQATNSGPNNLGTIKSSGTATGDADMDAYDQLGPKTRSILQNMPVKWDAAKTLQMIRSMRMDPVQHDSQIAMQMGHAVNLVHQQLKANPDMKTDSISA